MNLNDLPWLILNEIITYTVSEDRFKYCFLNKSWFTQCGGKFLTVSYKEEYNERTPILTWYLKLTENLILYDLTHVNWDYLNNLSISSIQLLVYNNTLDSKSREYLVKLLSFPKLKKLVVTFYNKSLEIDFINVLKDNIGKLLEIHLNDYNFQNQAYIQLMEDLKSNRLSNFSFKSQVENFCIENISNNIPNLRQLQVTLESSEENSHFLINTKMSKLNSLHLIQNNRHRFSSIIELDMSIFFNLKCLTIPGNTELINIDKATIKVEELYIYNPTVFLSDQIYLAFKNLKALTIDGEISNSELISSISKLCQNIKVLVFKNINSDFLFTKISFNNTTITSLELSGHGFLSSSLLWWISGCSLLTQLKIEDFYTKADTPFEPIPFDNLEEVYIFYYVHYNICEIERIFSKDRLPKIKKLCLDQN